MVWERSLKDRTFEFAVAILKLYSKLAAPNRAYAHIALQLFRSASSIGAQLEEGDVANSPRDMGSKHAIALREAKESRYWIRLFLAVGAFVPELRPLEVEAGEFVAMLTASVKKLRRKESAGEKQNVATAAFLFLTFALCLNAAHPKGLPVASKGSDGVTAESEYQILPSGASVNDREPDSPKSLGTAVTETLIDVALPRQSIGPDSRDVVSRTM